MLQLNGIFIRNMLFSLSHYPYIYKKSLSRLLGESFKEQ